MGCDIFLFANFALDKMAQFKKEAEQRKAEQEAKTRYWMNFCPHTPTSSTHPEQYQR